MSASTWSLSITDRERLIKAAFEAKEFAYSRYSKFRVGAALLSTDGQIIKGANIENASYGGTICAERTAFVKAVSEGTRSFSALAVVTDVASPLSPCGMCRQVIREFCAQNMPILLVPSDYDSRIAKGEKDGILETSIAELLPHSFGPEELELPREPSA
ncbi:cytidine deaminase [Abortiporus biennis]|nr:cytidine deaminase [Abortiporus biennis]